MCTSRSVGSCPRIYPGFVLLVIGTIYAVYLALVIIPQFQMLSNQQSTARSDPHAVHASYGEIIFVTAAFHLLLIMVLICYFKAMYTSPGYIPQTSFWREGEFVILERDNNTILDAIKPSLQEITDERTLRVIRSIPVVERKQDSGKFRICKVCNTFKPDRAHHCSICGKCVLRMDHHCPWVYNCIGFGNYRFFMQLLFYVCVTLIFVVATMMERLTHVFRPLVSVEYFLREDLPVVIVVLGSVFLCIMLVAFMVFHLQMINNAVTTIELKEKSQSKDEAVRRRWYVANLKYNLGTFGANMKHVMGTSYVNWFLPLTDNSVEDDAGTYRFGPWQDVDPVTGEYVKGKDVDTN